MPFDIALLAGRLDRGELSDVPIAPAMPMLTRGWALLHEDLDVPDWLLEANRHTLPALWTTLSPEGVALVGDRLGTMEYL
jgi:hypothetical protein